MAKVATIRKHNYFSKKFLENQVLVIDAMIENVCVKTQKFIRESQNNDLRRPTIDSDVADAANHFQSEAVRTRIASKDAHKLQLLIAAKKAISEGLYGLCIQCESKIPKKRLVAVPWANRCTFCQEIFDKERR